MKSFSISSYSNLLFASTIGTIGYNSFVCAQTKLNSNQSIILNCESDPLQRNSSVFGLLSQSDYMSDGCLYNDVSMVNTFCNNNTYYQEFFSQTCENLTNCSFLPNQSFFDSSSECQTKLNSGLYYIYFNAYCESDYMRLSGDSDIKKSYIPIIIAFFDAGIIISYLFMLISLKISQKKAINNVLHNSLSPALFTLEVSNLPHNLGKTNLIAELWKHMENVLNNAYKSYNKSFKIIDIQLAQKDSMINLSYKKGELVKKVLKFSEKIIFFLLREIK